jgi:hypothetical protein
MGTKFKWLVIGLLFIDIALTAQIASDYQSVDSLTYRYYNSRDWNNLIKLGSAAIDSGIDYKYLRQRLGFAFFSKGDFIRAGKHFEKALSFDSFDTFTLIYLYYSYLNAGQPEYARLIAGKMTPDLRKSLSVKLVQPIESVESEFNIKYVATVWRSSPKYFHIGLNSLLGPRFELYQMFSYYNQLITDRNIDKNENIRDKQPEYYTLITIALSQHWLLKSAYHYLNPIYNGESNSSHLGFLALSADFRPFELEINSSFLKYVDYSVRQTGIKSKVSFSGNMNMYFTGALSLINRQNINSIIYNQLVGLRVTKKAWVEGDLTLGDITDYHDYNAMYVYDLVDPTTLRAGATAYFYLGKHITLWTNYSYERKTYSDNSPFHYNQFSYLGGIKWKL